MSHPDLVGSVAQAADPRSAVQLALAALCNLRPGRRAAFVEWNPVRGALVRCWTGPDRAEPHEIHLAPDRLHPLLLLDAAGGRPLRPADDAADWVLREILPGPERRGRVWVRAVADGGELVAVLVVVEPKGWQIGGPVGIQGAADVLELAVGRFRAQERLVPVREEAAALARRLAEVESELGEARRDAAETERILDAAGERLAAMEAMAARGTELLEDAHLRLSDAERDAGRAERFLSALQQLLDPQAAASSAGRFAEEVVQLASELSGGARCSLLLLDRPHAHGGGELRLAAERGLPNEVDAARVRVPYGERVSGWVAKYSTPLRVRDRREAPAFPRVNDAGYTDGAFVSVPLIAHGHTVGVLNLSNFGPAGPPDDVTLAGLELFARCAALRVDQARLSERLVV